MVPSKNVALSPLLQTAYALAGGILLILATSLVLLVGSSLYYAGRVLPGVSMNGIPLGGFSKPQAAAQIATNIHYLDSGNLLLVDGDQAWALTPVQLGYYLDPLSSAEAAFDAGRKGNLFDLLRRRFNLTRQNIPAQPAIIFDQQTAVAYLNTLAGQIDQPIREASISLNGTEVVVQNGQSGRVLDIQATIDAITNQVLLMSDGVVPLVIHQADPLILNADAQADLARAVLSQPLTLVLPAGPEGQPTSLEIPASSLAPLLSFEKISNGGSAQFQIALNQPLMTAYLTSLADEVDFEPENARFIFNDDTGQLDLYKPAVIGRALNAQASTAAIAAALQRGEHSAPLSFNFNNPQVTDQMTGAELGIKELVYEYYSYFRGSDADRIQNIRTAAERFKGLLVAPGETLSMSDVLGDISLDNGYAEALIILGDETIKGVGGGVCQVSTTLFRTAFYAGYPIIERHPHAYRVRYYEQTASGHDSALAGLDATVFVPLVDFKFKNDTPYWLLMETYIINNNSLQWKFYSTRDGRVVESSTSGISNVVESPDPVYRENPEFEEGKIKQVDWKVEGADVTVYRTVTLNGSVLYQDRFFTRYEPWGDVFEYGPGTEIPTPTPSP